jgi:hypothetical protein
MYTEYDWSTFLDKKTEAERKKYNSKKVITTPRAWRDNDRGSATCATANWNSIYAAYDEYKKCKEW